MPRIELQTVIKADKKVVFDLSRSIDLHEISTEHTNEKAIAGKTNGLIGLNETVTWRAKHLGIYQKLTTKITEYNYPNYFADEMISGAFKSFKHGHYFSDFESGTLMVDIFDYTSPLGVLGRLADSLFLKNYMKTLLENRNKVIKAFAESGEWQKVLFYDNE